MGTEVTRILSTAEIATLNATSGTNTGDEVFEYANFAGFPGIGVAGVIYVAQDTNILYRWDGAVYVILSDSNLNPLEVSEISTANSVSPDFVLVPGMTLTPTAGTYLVVFSSTIYGSSNNTLYNYTIYVDGVQIVHSERRYRRGNGVTTGIYVPASTNAIVTVNGSQDIEIRFRAPSGTVTMYERTLNIIKVG